MGKEQIFRVNGVSNLHWTSWDDEFMAFDETSGQTHLMDPLRALVLDALSAEGLSFASALELLEQSAFLAHTPILMDLLATILSEFKAAGLVEVSDQ